MINLICVNDFGSPEDNLCFKIGEIYHAVGETQYSFDRWEIDYFYVFYTDYDYDREIWKELEVPTWYFMTPAEYRDKKIEEILSDTL